jgi:hypothetical protein
MLLLDMKNCIYTPKSICWFFHFLVNQSPEVCVLKLMKHKFNTLDKELDMKKTMLSIGFASLIAIAPATIQAQESVELDVGDRIEQRTDNRGDRINERLDRRGDRINDRLDARADRARENGRDALADRLDQKGDRIDQKLDKRGDRIDRRLDQKGKRVNQKKDRMDRDRKRDRFNARRNNQQRDNVRSRNSRTRQDFSSSKNTQRVRQNMGRTHSAGRSARR